MQKNYNVFIEKDTDGWYISEVLELPGCYSQGKILDQLLKRTKEAIKAYTITENINIPISKCVGIYQLEV